MRWDRLFDDLESQLEQELGAEEVDLAVEEERLRLGRLSLRDRLAAMAGPGEAARGPLLVETVAGAALPVRVDAVGRDWIAGELAVEGARRSAVVPLAAVAAVRPGPERLAAGLLPAPAVPVASLSSRLGLVFVLRDLCRRRVVVTVETVRGARHGTIDRVARDHLDLAEHDPGEPRRSDAVHGVRLLPLAAIDHLRY